MTSIRFSVDNHPLTLIEADGTLLTPSNVSGVTVAVGQRYSVLLFANQTSVANGTYWMRATLQRDMFTYDQPGQNIDIRGIFRCVTTFFLRSCYEQGSLMSPPGTQTVRKRECPTTLALRIPARVSRA